MLAGDMPAAAQRSQPEFDFEDEEPGAITHSVVDDSAPQQTQLAEPMTVRPAVIAAQVIAPDVLAQREIAEPVSAHPIDASSFEANLVDANPVETAAAPASIEPAATEPQLVDVATTPTASIEPAASASAEIESTEIEPAVPMFAEIEPQATDNAASAAVADAVATPSSVPAPSPGLFDMLPNAPVIDIDPAEEAAKAVAHVNEAADGSDNETARNA